MYKVTSNYSVERIFSLQSAPCSGLCKSLNPKYCGEELVKRDDKKIFVSVGCVCEIT